MKIFFGPAYFYLFKNFIFFLCFLDSSCFRLIMLYPQIIPVYSTSSGSKALGLQ